MAKKDILTTLEEATRGELSPAKAKTTLRALTELLHEDTEPMDCEDDFFIGCYSSLEDNARQYSTLLPEEQKDYLHGNLKVLETLEFQVSWHVLQEMGKKRFKQLAPEQRKEGYLRRLYRQAEKFPFFEQRRKAIVELYHAQMIERKDYEPHLN